MARLRLHILWFQMIPALAAGGFLFWTGYWALGVVVPLAILGFWILPELLFSKK
jgi:hypothetical protein